MAEQRWSIKAAHACTARGSDPASLWASAAGFQAVIQPEPNLSQFVEDQALASLTSPAGGDYQPNDVIRSQSLAASLLAGWKEPLPTSNVTLALTLGRPGEGYRGGQRVEQLRAGLVAALRIAGAPHWAEWCSAATLASIDCPQDWERISRSSSAAVQPDILWLSADSLINPGALKQLGDRVSNEQFTDGLVLGEGASVLWLQPLPQASNHPLAQLTLHTCTIAELNAEQSPLSSIDPNREGLVNHALTDPKSQTQWYRWLDTYPEADALTEPQHNWLTAGLGYLGSAGWSLGILAALGRLPMPCPPVNRVQALHQMPAGHWFLATLEPANPASESHAMSTTDTHFSQVKGSQS
ncbi:hypothetical protein [Saccharospirillum impatiens]|uniref:hypothetical protein n=1 Tax=Saccharospirillum impatiens TaxID=169438 RepID=UPI00042620BC|nr:hypothetical protein [Saccharospirillum impatiens]